MALTCIVPIQSSCLVCSLIRPITAQTGSTVSATNTSIKSFFIVIMSSQEPVVHGPPLSKQKLSTRMRRYRKYSGAPKLRAPLSLPFGSTGCITLSSLMSVYGRDGAPSARFLRYPRHEHSPLRCRHGPNYGSQDTLLLMNQLSDEYSPLWSADDNQWEGSVGATLDEHCTFSWQQCRGLRWVLAAPLDPHQRLCAKLVANMDVNGYLYGAIGAVEA